MSEKKSNEKLKYKITILSIILIVVVVLSFILVYEVQILRSKLETTKLVIEAKSNIINEYEKKGSFEIDCETESDALLRKHIGIYIKKRYTKTPTIIAREISKRVILLSKHYNLSPELIVGIIEVESMFNPLLESSKGAKGLMQVMPEWVPKLGLKDVNDLHEIDIGIESGIKVFLIHLEEAKGNISKGLYRYVNRDHSYVEKVYSSVGRFVTYRSTIKDSEKNIKKEKNNEIKIDNIPR